MRLTRRDHNLRGLLTFALAALVLAAPGAVLAQPHGQDVVQGYIERTDELIEWARELVEETDSGTARRVLRQGYDLNRKADDMNNGGRVNQAGQSARRARAAVWHAVKLAREAMGLQERLRVRAERFLEIHLQLTDRARDTGNEEALELLRRAEGQAFRAREQHLQGDMRMAWQMFERSEELMQRAARLMADTGDPARLEAEWERVGELIERTVEATGEDASDRTRRRLAEAEEAHVRARRYLDDGEYGRGLQMLSLARRLARDAAGEVPGGSEAAALQRQLQRFDERAGRVGELVRDAGDESARRLYEQALNHRDRARTAGERGDHEAGLRQIRAGHDLLGQVERKVR